MRISKPECRAFDSRLRDSFLSSFFPALFPTHPALFINLFFTVTPLYYMLSLVKYSLLEEVIRRKRSALVPNHLPIRESKPQSPMLNLS